MRITVFGIGYVGLVQAAVLADLGNQVLCVDTDEDKILGLRQGVIPIYEPGLEDLVIANAEAKRLQFTSDAARALVDPEVIFIAVGTPMDNQGAADMQYVDAVAQTIARHLMNYAVVVIKSTVPVGTGDRIAALIAKGVSEQGRELEFDLVSNPEFLKEGAAVADCARPDRIILGCDSDRALMLMRVLYQPFNRNHQRTLVMDRRSAELSKYAANCMLATKISFMNEMANLAEQLGADIELVRNGIGSDPRIGYHFIYPGCGYGGSCFPKDINALLKTARDNHFEAPILRSVRQVNDRQKHKLLHLIQHYYQGELKGRCFSVWGATFKPNTDDIREAPSLVIIEALLNAGANIKLHDPVANDQVASHFNCPEQLQLCAHPMEVHEASEGLIICTEWKAFKAPDFQSIRKSMKTPVIFDGRNLFDPEYMETLGIAYYAIGRGKSVKKALANEQNY